MLGRGLAVQYGLVARLGIRVTRVNSFAGQVRITMLTNVAIAGMGVVTGVLLARLLGPGGRGELAAIQLWPSQIATLAMLGLDSAVVFFAGRHPDRAGRYLSSSIALILLAGGAFVLGGWLGMPVLLRSQTPEVVLAAQLFLPGILVAYALGGMPQQMLRAVGAWRMWNVMRLAAPMSWLVCLLAASVMPMWAAPVTLSRGYVLASFVTIAPVIVVVGRSLHGRSAAVDRALFRPLLSYGLPCMLTILPQVMNLRLDQLMMATFLAPGDLGLYVVAVAWSGAATPLLGAVGPVLFPNLASVRDPGKRRALVGRTVVSFGVANAALSILVLLVTPVAVPLLFGVAFGPAVLPAAILVVASMFSALSSLLEDVLRGLGRPRTILGGEVAGLAVTVVLLGLLLPQLGIVGAAIASLGSYLAISIVLGTHIVRWGESRGKELNAADL